MAFLWLINGGDPLTNWDDPPSKPNFSKGWKPRFLWSARSSPDVFTGWMESMKVVPWSC